MNAAPVAWLAEPDRVRLALSPLRRRLLERLRAPASATALAAELGLGRQRVNYHLRALEAAGLVDLVEERPRRGCVERILAARAQAFVVDPAVLGGGRTRPVRAAAQDRFAAGQLLDLAAGLVRDVARMQARAQAQGTRLVTFSLETEVSVATPQDLDRFVTAVAAAIARAARPGQAPGAGRRYRVVLGAHPAPGKDAAAPRAPRPPAPAASPGSRRPPGRATPPPAHPAHPRRRQERTP